MSVVSIGLDLAKSVFQVHGVDASGHAVLRRKLARGGLIVFFTKQPPCLVGMEACSSAHHWARELVRLGHEVRLIPPQYVKPYVKQQDRCSRRRGHLRGSRPTEHEVRSDRDVRAAEHPGVIGPCV